MRRTTSKSGPARTAQAILQARAETFRESDERFSQLVERLATDIDMASLVDELGHEQVGPLLGAIYIAHLRAEDEAARPTQTDERDALERVIRAARTLGAALEAAPLSNLMFPVGELRPGEHSVGMDPLAFITIRNVTTKMGPTISLPAVLSRLCEHVGSRQLMLPPRAVQRMTKDPYWPAFTRWLNLLLNTKGVPVSTRGLTVVLNAVGGRFEDPWTQNQVKAILRDQPESFKVPKKRRTSP